MIVRSEEFIKITVIFLVKPILDARRLFAPFPFGAAVTKSTLLIRTIQTFHRGTALLDSGLILFPLMQELRALSPLWQLQL